MFLGTSRAWWILSGVLLLAGFGLMLTSSTMMQTVLGILSLFAAIGIFAAAPMRYGENARLSRKERRAREAAAREAARTPSVETPVAELPPPPPLVPRERPAIAGRDASEV